MSRTPSPASPTSLLARFADEVFISLEESEQFFPEGKDAADRQPDQAADPGCWWKTISLAASAKEGTERDFRLLVFGGSAGAHTHQPGHVAALPHPEASSRDRLAITHQTGEKDLAEVREAYRRQGFKAEVVPFIEDMAAAYAQADLVVCRAGATTIAEVTACGKACIFIPFPYAVDDHQRQ